MLLINHLHSSIIQNNNSIAVCCYFSFKCLMFLNLRLEKKKVHLRKDIQFTNLKLRIIIKGTIKYLQIGGIFVALIRGSLQLLIDPQLQFISIAFEVLETKNDN